jgi:hypothetical protein
MSSLTREAYVTNGRIALEDLPFADNTALTIVLIPKFKINMEGWLEARRLTATITGSLPDDQRYERDY